MIDSLFKGMFNIFIELLHKKTSAVPADVYKLKNLFLPILQPLTIGCHQ
jgi:hypothetical protein